MANLTILGLILMTASVQGMPGGDDDSGRSSWAADIRGITPFKAVDREVQPNIMNVHVGRPLWRQLRFKIIRSLIQARDDLWDHLLDMGDPKIKLAVDYGLGDTATDRKLGRIDDKDARFRGLNILLEYLPPCDWLDELMALPPASHLLEWMQRLDDLYLGCDRKTMLSVQTKLYTVRWLAPMLLVHFIAQFRRLVREHERLNNMAPGNFDANNYWDQFTIAMTDLTPRMASDGWKYFRNEFAQIQMEINSVKNKITFTLIAKWEKLLVQAEKNLRDAGILPAADLSVHLTDFLGDRGVTYNAPDQPTALATTYFTPTSAPRQEESSTTELKRMVQSLQSELHNLKQHANSHKTDYRNNKTDTRSSNKPTPTSTSSTTDDKKGTRYGVLREDFYKLDQLGRDMAAAKYWHAQGDKTIDPNKPACRGGKLDPVTKTYSSCKAQDHAAGHNESQTTSCPYRPNVDLIQFLPSLCQEAFIDQSYHALGPATDAGTYWRLFTGTLDDYVTVISVIVLIGGILASLFKFSFASSAMIPVVTSTVIWAEVGITNADVITNIAVSSGTSMISFLGFLCVFTLGFSVGYYTGCRVHTTQRDQRVVLPVATNRRCNMGDTTPTYITCDCNGGGSRVAAKKVSRTTRNPGRAFFCCSKHMSSADRCCFFLWADESAVGGGYVPVATPVAPGMLSPAGTAPSRTSVNRRPRRVGTLLTFFTLLKLAGGTPTVDQLRHSYTFDMFEDTHSIDRLTTFNQQQRLDHLLASHNDSCIAVGMTGTMFSNVVTPPMFSNMVASAPMPGMETDTGKLELTHTIFSKMPPFATIFSKMPPTTGNVLSEWHSLGIPDADEIDIDTPDVASVVLGLLGAIILVTLMVLWGGSHHSTVFEEDCAVTPTMGVSTQRLAKRQRRKQLKHTMFIKRVDGTASRPVHQRKYNRVIRRGKGDACKDTPSSFYFYSAVENLFKTPGFHLRYAMPRFHVDLINHTDLDRAIRVAKIQDRTRPTPVIEQARRRCSRMWSAYSRTLKIAVHAITNMIPIVVLLFLWWLSANNGASVMELPVVSARGSVSGVSLGSKVDFETAPTPPALESDSSKGGHNYLTYVPDPSPNWVLYLCAIWLVVRAIRKSTRSCLWLTQVAESWSFIFVSKGDREEHQLRTVKQSLVALHDSDNTLAADYLGGRSWYTLSANSPSRVLEICKAGHGGDISIMITTDFEQELERVEKQYGITRLHPLAFRSPPSPTQLSRVLCGLTMGLYVYAFCDGIVASVAINMVCWLSCAMVMVVALRLLCSPKHTRGKWVYTLLGLLCLSAVAMSIQQPRPTSSITSDVVAVHGGDSLQGHQYSALGHPMPGIHDSAAQRSAKTVLNTNSNMVVHKTVRGRPDTQANVTTVPSESYLSKVWVRGGVGHVNTASDAPAVATAVGEFRFGITADDGSVTTVTTTAHVIHSQPDVILGNNLLSGGLRFDTVDGAMCCKFNGQKLTDVPIHGGLYQIDIIVNPGTATRAPAWKAPNASQANAQSGVGTQPISVAEYFGGVGCASLGLGSKYKSILYADSDEQATSVFAKSHPHASLWGDLLDISLDADSKAEFVAEAKHAEVAVLGAPCNEHSVLHLQRGQKNKTRGLLAHVAPMLIEARHKILLVESVASWLSAGGGDSWNNFVDAVTPHYVLQPIVLDPLRHGGVQTRTRLWTALIRKDIAASRGLLEIEHGEISASTLGDYLEPVSELDLDALRDDRMWKRRSGLVTHEQRTRSQAVWECKRRSFDDFHNKAYDIDGKCPTLTTEATVIYDKRPGACLFRRLSGREHMRCQRIPDNVQFDGLNESEIVAKVGLGMELGCVYTLGKACSMLLRNTSEASVHSTVRNGNISAKEWHFRLGHPSPAVTRKMGFPVMKEPCSWCDQAKLRRANVSTAPIPKAKNKLDRVYMDIKVSSKPDKLGRTRCLGLVDSCTNDSWTIPLDGGTSSDVISALEDWQVNALKNAKVAEIVMDNDPAFTSAEMKQYLVKERRITQTYSCAYHQHQNGCAEALWNRLVPLTIINVMSAPWLGYQYWTWAMVYANESIKRRPSTANDSCESPHVLFTGRPNRAKMLRPWGSVCYVYNDKNQGFEARGKKGYLLGLSKDHADFVYDVYMCDTHRVRQTMNVVFHDNVIDASECPMECDLDLEVKKVAHAANDREEAPVGFEFRENSSAINTKACKLPLNAILQCTAKVDKLKPSNPRYSRCKAIHGKTVLQALHLTYDNGVALQNYKVSDLHYDYFKMKLLTVTEPTVHSTLMASEDGIDATRGEYMDGSGQQFENDWFEEETAKQVYTNADTDPLMTRGNWTFGIDIDGKQTLYEMKPDTEPDRTIFIHELKKVPKDGMSFVSHKQLKKLDEYERKTDILRAIELEYSDFDKRGMWRLHELQEGQVAHGMMLLVKVKHRPDGSEEKVKARAVILGNTMVKGRDHGETFAPCAQCSTAKAMICDAVQNGKFIKSCDVKQAFTFGSVDRRSFVRCPPGREMQLGPNGKPMVYEIMKNCYGSPAAPRRWNIAIHNALVEHGFVQSACDNCLYMLDDLRVLVYSDDMLCTGHCLDKYRQFVDMLLQKFELGDDGMTDCENYLGMHFEFNADKSMCKISQPLKVTELLVSSGLDSCKPAYTPGVPNTQILKTDCPADGSEEQREMLTKPYKSRIGSLMWLARMTRPDIAYQVGALARVMHNPSKKHWAATTHLIRYVAHTKEMGLIYKRDHKVTVSGQWKPTVWTDATWAPPYGDLTENYRSTTGWLTQFGQNTISWASHRQHATAHSSSESEWYAAGDGGKEAAHLRKLMFDLGSPFNGPINLRCDNQSTIKQTVNAVDQSQRHIGLRSHWIRRECNNNKLRLEFVPSSEQRADALTKNLPLPTFEKLRPLIGVAA